IHRGLARQYGYSRWSKLKSAIEAQQPLEQRAARFLRLAIDDEREEIEAMLNADAELARCDIWCAAAALNGAAVADLLQAQPQLLCEKRSGSQVVPLMYVAATRLQNGSELYEV